MESHIVGDLTPQLAEQLKTHLRQCDACQRRYEEQKRLIVLLQRVFATKQRFA
jgi:anti-sigma factor RsiW